jgi:hypothetical protein
MKHRSFDFFAQVSHLTKTVAVMKRSPEELLVLQLVKKFPNFYKT